MYIDFLTSIFNKRIFIVFSIKEVYIIRSEFINVSLLRS